MAWFRKDKKPLTARDRREVPQDVFDKCPGCGEILYRERLAQNLNVCPTCGHHLRIEAEAYLGILLDSDTFEETEAHLRAADPLEFRDLKVYPERIAAAEAKGKSEAVITGMGEIDGIPVVIANPRQVRDFAKATGQLAKTDAIDARILALFAARVQPPVRALPDEQAQALDGLLVS